MNHKVLAAIFGGIFLLAIIPLAVSHPLGSASAGLSTGFMLPIENSLHMFILIVIGVFAACLGEESLILVPLCVLLMLVIGAMMHIDEALLPFIRAYIVGAIVLFSLSVSMFRNKMYLLSVPPIAFWIYFVGGNYMLHIPAITSPIYFLLGMTLSVFIMLAIGVSLGVTLTESIRESLTKLKELPAIASFLSFF